MSAITDVRAREVLDSRGNPTVEVDVTADSIVSRAVVPSGASTGKYEAVELRDGVATRYRGKGVSKAVANVNDAIRNKLLGLDCTDQRHVDELMVKLDGTPNKGKLGANAVLGVSMAVCRAGAAAGNMNLFEYVNKLSGAKAVSVPTPFCNVINGGKHAGNKLAIQEFMIAPVGFKSFSEGMRAVVECYHELKAVLEGKYGKSAVNVGDEGGFAPDIGSAEEALGLLQTAIGNAGYKDKVKIAIDSAASEFYRQGFYYLPNKLSSAELVQYYLKLMKDYGIISFEDPFSQDDFESFAELTAKSKVQVIGDDLTVTNVERIRKAVQLKACNCLLLKVNQIGTVTEALAAANLAFKNNWKVMVSHRSGDTEDPFIADLAVGLGCGMIKSGAPCRAERTSKYNQLLRIEEILR